MDEKKKVAIVDYEAKYASDFRLLNEAWIKQYFSLEEMDLSTLIDPQKYILNSGGCIKVALLDEVPVGVCALIKMQKHGYDFEFAKLAVSPKAQGNGIGYALGQAIIEAAKSTGAQQIYLESSTKLKAAISLYHKLGFELIKDYPSPQSSCNLQMGLRID